MVYAAELFYLENQRDIPFQKVVLVTAKTVAQWCSHFQARLLSPAKKHIGLTERQGRLPMESLGREEFVKELVQWLFEHSTVADLFRLFLDDRPVPQAGRIAKFQHPDDTCCWFLNLTEDEFAILQDAWRKNNLPVNLFYPEHEMRCIPYPGRGLKSKILRGLGAKRCYTPMQWQTEFSQVQETAG
jgi:hypothetical protein